MKGPEDDAGLAGKVAIISGGGAAGDGIGNGRAAAILLARAGTRVLVADRDLKLAERTVEMIKTEGGLHAAAHAGDMTQEAECKRLVDAAVDRWGRLDFLVHAVAFAPQVLEHGLARVAAELLGQPALVGADLVGQFGQAQRLRQQIGRAHV